MDTVVVASGPEWQTGAAIVAALAAVAAVGVGVYQLRVQRRHAREQTAFEHLRRISGFVRNIVRWEGIRSLQKEIIRRYDGGEKPLSDDACDYMALLTELDLLAFAAEIGAADSGVVDQYTRSMYNESVVSVTFIREYHRCCKEEDSYRYLLARLEKVTTHVKRGLVVSNGEKPKSPAPEPKKPTPSPPRHVPNREKRIQESDPTPARRNFPQPRQEPGEGGGGDEE